jgi:uncharacterized membrane-anchored protein YitT (DUF2179 family)
MVFTYAPGLSQASLIPGYTPGQPFDPSNPQVSNGLNYSVSILSGAIGGLLVGLGTGIAFKIGASALGLDPVAKELRVRKNINISKALFVFAFFNSFL